MGITPAPSQQDVEMTEEPPAGEGLPEAVVSRIDEVYQTLSAARKKRKPPPVQSTLAQVKKLTKKHTISSLHSSSHAGINALALSSATPSHVLTGGNDKVVQLYDRDADKVLASLKGHTKKVNHVAFRERGGDPTLILSGSADKTVKIWSHDSASDEYIPKSTIRTHKGEIVGLVVHPTSTILALASADKTYSLYDISTYTPLFQSKQYEEPFSALAVHPDGTLLALGTPSSGILIYDVKSGAVAAYLTPEDSAPFAVNTLSFSENGYSLLAPVSASSVAVWDLRKRKAGSTIQLSDTFKVNKVRYDPSAHYFGVCGNEGIGVFAHKTWEELFRSDEAGGVADLAFGGSTKEMWGVSGREIRIWGVV
jgi:pre-mRNA-processing factor 19